MVPWLTGLCVAAWLLPRADAAPLSPDDVVRAALARDADAIAARGDVVVAGAERRAVGTFLDNPQVQVGVSPLGDLTFVQAQQPLSLSGEGWFARREARLGLAAAEAGAGRATLRVAAEARVAWARAATAVDRAAITDGALGQAGSLRAAVEARAAIGDASALDVALARSAEAEAATRAIDAQRARAEALVALAAWHPDALVDGVAGDPLAAAPPSTVSPGGVRSDVRAAEARREASRAGLARAKAAAMPLAYVGVQFQSDGGSIDLGPMATLTLPLWAHNQAGIGEAKARLAIAEAAVSVSRARADAEGALADETADAALDVWRRLDRFREDAAAGIDAVEEAFRAGELDVRDTVLLRERLVTGELAWLDARQDTIELRIAALLAHDDPALLPAEEAR